MASQKVAMTRRSSLRSLVAVVAGSSLLSLTLQRLSTSFCGSQALPRSQLARSKNAASAEEEIALASPEISEPLRFGSGLTGLIRPALQAQAKFAAGDYDEDRIRSLIEAESKSAPVVMYTLSQSPFSIDAKRLLNESSIEFKEIELAPLFILAEGDNAARRAELGKMTGRTSMPHIFINGQSIGGLYEGTPGLVPLIESGELADMVKPKEESPFDALAGLFR
eukprot:TRINITY_DN79040_c0_g1_i1.p1 TRINITY_DN79040_c0_g1~~TRINITY_DN79040_c0_g1_i1.p1  ORF type:complete len:223 (-),score=56.37 TRINITY_DN79040_c0_g1_i1:53-721(-)